MRPALFLTVYLLLAAAPLQASVQKNTPPTENIDFVAISKAQNPDAAAEDTASAQPLQTSPDFKRSVREYLNQNGQSDNADTPRQAWENADSDIVVQQPDAPPPPKPAADKGKNPPPPPKVNVQLRKQPPEKTAKTKKTAPSAKSKDTGRKAAAVVSLPSAKPAAPALTRRQTLEREIRRERAALQTAKAQLAAAQKKGNAKQAAKLQTLIKDRELNIQAIEREMIR